jgi:predicted permease
MKHDIVFALRLLRKSPGFGLVVVLTLGLGIGANVAIFSVVRHVLYAQLPFAAPDRLAAIFLQNPEHNVPKDLMSYPRFVDTRAAAGAFEGMTAFVEAAFTLRGAEEPEQIRGAVVSAEFFDVMGVKPKIGRTFQRGEDESGRDQVIVLSHVLWARRFAASPAVLGTRIVLNLRPYTVIGVMPSAFNYPGDHTEVWIPLAPHPVRRAERRSVWLSVVGRLKPGVSFAQAKAELDALAQSLGERFPDTDRRTGTLVTPLRDESTESLRIPLRMVSWAVVCVLLLACTNVAGMMLARAAGRDKEVSVRVALGAIPSRIVRQLLTESTVLFGIAGLMGVGLSLAIVWLTARLAPTELAALRTVRVDTAAAAFGMLVAIATGLLFGLVPATNAIRANDGLSLRQRGAAAGVQRSRHVLVMIQIALAIVLLVASSLLLRSFLKLTNLDYGINPQHVLTARVILPASRYPPEKARQFMLNLLDRLRVLPGVQAAAVISSLLLGEIPDLTDRFTVEGRAQRGGVVDIPAAVTLVSPALFATIGQRILAGRDFDARDHAGAPPVAIVNERLAKQYWSGQSPLGRRFRMGGAGESLPWITIVGVVADTRRRGLEKDIWAEFYLPAAQNYPRSVTLVVRSTTDTGALARELRRQVQTLDHDQPVSAIAMMEQLLDDRIAPRRFYMTMLVLLSATALLLAGVGLYGVLSHLVALRTQEIGVRMAVGATQANVLALVSRRTIGLMAGGVAGGLVLALLFAQGMSRLLFGVSAHDPIALAASTLLIVMAGVAATYLPARRAMRVDPNSALRHE